MRDKGICFTIGASLIFVWGTALGATDLIINGNFEGVFTPDGTGDSVPAGWIKHESRPAEGSTIGQDPSNGPSLPGSSSVFWNRPSGGGSGDRSGVEQSLSIDAADYLSLVLNIDVRVDSHNLEAGGTVSPAFEWPVMVEIRYTLKSNPLTTQIWRHGWYVDPPGDGRVNDPGSGIITTYNDTLVSKGVWTANSFDLFTELPDLGVITHIQVAGSGWNFAGAADNVRILGQGWWKGPQPNFAPSGMPDFDQRQGEWAHAILCGSNLTADSIASGDDIQLVPQGATCGSRHDPVIEKGADRIMQSLLLGDDDYRWEYCVPTSIASCLMWFDSKFEANTAAPPCDGADTYGLVQAYPSAADDHCDDNVNNGTTPAGADPNGTVFGELVEDLAWRMDTGGQQSLTAGKHGTVISDAESAVAGYIREKGLFDRYLIRLEADPDYAFIEREILRSQDLILALSFYQSCPGKPARFIGGHAATVAGVSEPGNAPEICLSDPFLDQAEAGSTGRVLPPGPHPHFNPEMLHNDALFVSHDCYPVQTATSGFGQISIPQWGTIVPPPGQGGEEQPLCDDVSNFFGQNGWVPGDPAFTPRVGSCAADPFIPCSDFPLDPICPPIDQTCVPEPPCDPDGSCTIETVVSFALEISPFFFKDGGWTDYAPSGMPDIDQRTDAGFVCPATGFISHCGPASAADSMWWFDSVREPFPVPPPAVNDGYPLVQDLTGGGDDHDPLNAAALIQELADNYFNTNNSMGLRSTPHCGTYIDDMEAGLNQWLVNHGVDADFYVEVLPSPTFDLVASEVEQSHDVLLQLGFWQYQTVAEQWVRTGGHYVACAGVDRPNQVVAFSDPGLDHAEGGSPGRVLGPQPHGILGNKAHDDVENISHDIYDAVPTSAPVGVWGPAGYAGALGLQLDKYAGQNSSDALDQAGFPGSRNPLEPPPDAVVENALVVRPCPPDMDGDGFTICTGDCNDADPNVLPGRAESCDLIDNNCDGFTDEGFDADSDGFTSCGGDCNDADPNIFPGATEICDGLDNDCDPSTDEVSDADSDGVSICGGDCDDTDPNVLPGAIEICDGFDNDCDSLTDEGFVDNDGDGAGDVCDCAPTDPNLWSAPASPVRVLTVDHVPALSLTTIRWSRPTRPGSRLVLYDIFQSAHSATGTIPPNLACLEPDTEAELYSTMAVPSSGAARLFLIRPQTSCGLGPAGNVGGSNPALPSCP